MSDYIPNQTRVKFNGGGPSNGRPGTIQDRKLCPSTKTWDYVIAWDNGGKVLLPPELFDVIEEN